MFTGEAGKQGYSTGISFPASLNKAKKDGTLSMPSRNDAITSCSQVMLRHIQQQTGRTRGSTGKPDVTETYDIDNFIKTQHHHKMVPMVRTVPFFSFVQTKKTNAVPVLEDDQKIHRFVKRIVDRCHLNAEVVIIALIYIERLMSTQNLRLTERNWIPITIVSLLTASKVWDDHSTFNGDLCIILPIFTIQDINELERRFLTDLNYTLHITFQYYAKYYFGLRSLRQQVPKHLLHVGLGNARHVEEKTLRSEATQRGMPLSL